MSNGSFWTPQQWAIFDGSPAFDRTPATPGLLRTAMAPNQVAQQVFGVPTPLGSDSSIPADTTNPATGEPTVGETRKLATFRKQFQLAPLHIADPRLVVATSQANFAAQTLALAEDRLFFQGAAAPLPATVVMPDTEKAKLNNGLLGVADVTHPVNPRDRANRKYGVNSVTAVIEMVNDLANLGLLGPYALVLSKEVYSDVSAPLDANPLITALSSILNCLRGGVVVPSAGLPPHTGLLASLGSNATTLYVGTAPVLEATTYDGFMQTLSARESIQFVNTDPRALVRLNFMP
jgi:hypothetical protein